MPFLKVKNNDSWTPVGWTPQVQADWEQTDQTQPDFIKNKPVDKYILFESADGDNATATIELADDVSNYSHIEVIYGMTDDVSSARVLNGQTVAMSITQSDSDCFKITTGTATLSGTQLTRGAEGTERQLIINHATEGQLDFTGSTPDSGYYISIYRVIGYK